MLFSEKQAGQFFRDLRAASVEFLQHHGLPIDQGRKRYATWKEGYPIGVTAHYTAGVTWKGTVNWLNDGTNKNSVSCQMLILDRMLPEYQDITDRYPALRDLRVTTIMLSDGIIPCWHAGWVNKFTFGIENRNAGQLKYDRGKWYWWAKKWCAEFPVEGLGKTPVNFGGQWWEPYTFGQICDNILVCQMLHSIYPKLSPSWFLPHSATTGTKYDTGRAYPLDKVRSAVFSQKHVEDLIWLHDYRYNTKYMEDYAEEEDNEFLLEMAFKQEDRFDYDDARELPKMVMEEPPEADLQYLIQEGEWKKELGAVRRALHRLGYYVPATASQTLDKDTATAVYQFQKSMGLKTDKVPGGVTQMALMKRLKQFNLG
jgi:N-acetyl-anhydromuramyl-L-alanine amidase AmpD